MLIKRGDFVKKCGACLLVLLLCAGCGPAEAPPERPAEETLLEETSAEESPADTVAAEGAALLERAGVPPGAGETVRDWAAGDLGNDGVPDWAVVVDGAAPEPDGDFAATPRTLYLLSETAEGGLTVTHASGGILLGRECGGVWGDPYLGVDLQDGNLRVLDYGGSAFRWSHVYTFVPEGEDLVLSRIAVERSCTHTGNGVAEVYGLPEGTAEETTFSYVMEEYRPLTLYRGTFPPVRIRLEDASAWQEAELDCTPRYPMPWLTYYYFKDLDPAPVRSAEEILDIVHREKHPELERVEMACGEELLDNWSQALGYEAPRWYYAGNGRVLSYAEAEWREYEADWVHTVLYQDADGNTDFYWYWDASGQERTFD